MMSQDQSSSAQTLRRAGPYTCCWGLVLTFERRFEIAENLIVFDYGPRRVSEVMMRWPFRVSIDWKG